MSDTRDLTQVQKFNQEALRTVTSLISKGKAMGCNYPLQAIFHLEVCQRALAHVVTNTYETVRERRHK